MIILYSLSLLLLIASLYEFQRNKYNDKSVCVSYSISNKIIVFFVALILTIISAMRGFDVGADLINYIPRYEIIGKSLWSDLLTLSGYFNMEYGFCVFNKSLYIFNASPRFFLCVTSIIIGIGFYKLASFSKMPLFSFFIIYMFGFWGSSLNIVRQFLAISIVFWGFNYVIERKIVKYLFIIFLATLLHSSAIFALPLYSFYNIKFDLKKFYMLCVCYVIIFIFVFIFFDRLIYMSPWAKYLYRGYHGSGSSTFLLVFNIMFFACFYYKNLKNNDKNISLWIGNMAYSIIFFLFAFKNGIFARMIKYYLPCIAVLVPNMIYAMRKNSMCYSICYFIAILFFTFYFLFVFMGKQIIGDRLYDFVLLE